MTETSRKAEMNVHITVQAIYNATCAPIYATTDSIWFKLRRMIAAAIYDRTRDATATVISVNGAIRAVTSGEIDAAMHERNQP